jgi:lipopolysaccharide/colanic/teichoic acid biosynthesis glycosyltransferase
MSIVGPRPERPEFVEDLIQGIRYYDERHLVKPGLTGWAQINYGYGCSVQDAKRKLYLDLYYIKNMSMELDLVILFRTLGTLCSGPA